MRILTTLFKVIIGLAIAIPLGIVALALTVGILGSVLGIAKLVLKLACVGFLGYGLFSVARALFGGRSTPQAQARRELRPADPYYDAAMRELDSEMNVNGGRL